MTRARRAAAARPRPDRTRASRSDRWSVVSTSDVDGMRHHMIYNSLVQATRAGRCPDQRAGGVGPDVLVFLMTLIAIAIIEPTSAAFAGSTSVVLSLAS